VCATCHEHVALRCCHVDTEQKTPFLRVSESCS